MKSALWRVRKNYCNRGNYEEKSISYFRQPQKGRQFRFFV